MKKDMHGAQGREYMLAVCTDLKAAGATEPHIKMFARLIYEKKYDEARTLHEWSNIDPAKTWRCEVLKAKLPSYIDIVQCDQCAQRRKSYEEPGAQEAKAATGSNSVTTDNHCGSCRHKPNKGTICRAMQQSSPSDIMTIAQTVDLSRSRVHQLIHGSKQKPESGLVFKVKGLHFEKCSIKTGDSSIHKTYYSLTDFDTLGSYSTVVSLPEAAKNEYKLEFDAIIAKNGNGRNGVCAVNPAVNPNTSTGSNTVSSVIDNNNKREYSLTEKTAAEKHRQETTQNMFPDSINSVSHLEGVLVKPHIGDRGCPTDDAGMKTDELLSMLRKYHAYYLVDAKAGKLNSLAKKALVEYGAKIAFREYFLHNCPEFTPGKVDFGINILFQHGEPT